MDGENYRRNSHVNLSCSTWFGNARVCFLHSVGSMSIPVRFSPSSHAPFPSFFSFFLPMPAFHSHPSLHRDSQSGDWLSGGIWGLGGCRAFVPQSICGESFLSGGGGAQENAAFFLRFQWNSCQKVCLLFWGPDKICFRTLVFRVGGMLASDSKGDRDCVYMRCSSVFWTIRTWCIAVYACLHRRVSKRAFFKRLPPMFGQLCWLSCIPGPMQATIPALNLLGPCAGAACVLCLAGCCCAVVVVVVGGGGGGGGGRDKDWSPL